jgi:hypothetical protein
MAMFNRLAESRQYDLEAQQQAIQQAVDAGQAAPVFMATSSVVLISLAWASLFLGAAYLFYDRRDL